MPYRHILSHSPSMLSRHFKTTFHTHQSQSAIIKSINQHKVLITIHNRKSANMKHLYKCIYTTFARVETSTFTSNRNVYCLCQVSGTEETWTSSTGHDKTVG